MAPPFGRHLKLVWYICFSLWTNTDMILPAKIHNLHKGLFFAFYNFMGFNKCLISPIFTIITVNIIHLDDWGVFWYPIKLHAWSKVSYSPRFILTSRRPDPDHHLHSLTWPQFPRPVGRNSHPFSALIQGWNENQGEKTPRGLFLLRIIPNTLGLDNRPPATPARIIIPCYRWRNWDSGSKLLTQGHATRVDSWFKAFSNTLLLGPRLLGSCWRARVWWLGWLWSLITPLFRNLKAAFSRCLSRLWKPILYNLL